MVVFGVAGLITLQTPVVINHPYLTLAGQTAPGDGICIRGQSVHINTHDVIIRYLRFRRGNLKVRDDALGGYPVANVIIDHVSASWGLDENLSLYRWIKTEGGKMQKMPLENVTIQWSISSEALNLNNHAFGGTWGGEPCSFHHNLFACNTGRNPSIGMGGLFDFRNNVLFNWVHRTIDGGDGSSRINLVANYFKAGPATKAEALRHRICKIQRRGENYEYPGCGHWYVAGNYVDGYPRITADNWDGGVFFAEAGEVKGTIIPQATEEESRSREPFPAPPVHTQTAEEAYELVLAQAGASLPRRDAVDERIIATVRTGRPAFGDGIIDSPADVGGWPEYRSAPAPEDHDTDGMSDAWEQAHGLDPADPSDARSDSDHDGYTAVEEYLNGTDPTTFVDYTKPENNRNTLHTPAEPRGARR
ncbi:MAG: polysaccharide lyase [Isosphaeraceae bacterium]|nr:polysaccharide lyase [Isosphaeraceae bacterium]